MDSTLSNRLKLRVRSVESVAEGIVELRLEPDELSGVPAWEPGAHVDIELPSGLMRQYSLCGSPGVTDTYAVAVLREPNGRGGSAEIHERVVEGTTLFIRGPRNHFPFVESPRYLFIAGGIGITPILPMLEAAERAAADWKLIYGGRSTASMAFVHRLLKLGPDRVSLLPEDSCGRPNLPLILGDVDSATQIYCCGPPGLLNAVEEQCDQAGLSKQLHTERFTAPPPGAATGPSDDDGAFDVRLETSGLTVRVGGDETILAALQDSVDDLAFSCEEGFCGACEVRVLSGTPDHRDTVASASEHDDEGTMMICVGRSKSPLLVLDL